MNTYGAISQGGLGGGNYSNNNNSGFSREIAINIHDYLDVFDNDDSLRGRFSRHFQRQKRERDYFSFAFILILVTILVLVLFPVFQEKSRREPPTCLSDRNYVVTVLFSIFLGPFG